MAAAALEPNEAALGTSRNGSAYAGALHLQMRTVDSLPVSWFNDLVLLRCVAPGGCVSGRQLAVT